MENPSASTKGAFFAGACVWLLAMILFVSSAACVRQQACGWEAMAAGFALGAAMLGPAWLAFHIVNQWNRPSHASEE